MIKQAFFAIFILFITACSAHRVDIQQGNVLTKETMDKIKVGMNQRQIRALAGTPLVTDPFRKNRWDFVYSMKQGETQELQYSYVSLIFTDDKVSEIKIHKEPIAEKDLKTPGLGLRSGLFNSEP